MIANHKYDKMMYRNNKLSYQLMFLGIVTNIIYVIMALNTVSTATYGLFTGIKVLFNIILLLLIFLSMEKIKVYNKKYSVFMICLSAFMTLRIFWFPMMFLNGKNVNAKFDGQPYQWRGIFMIILMVITIICFMIAAIIGYHRSKMVEVRRKLVSVNGK